MHRSEGKESFATPPVCGSLASASTGPANAPTQIKCQRLPLFPPRLHLCSKHLSSLGSLKLVPHSNARKILLNLHSPHSLHCFNSSIGRTPQAWRGHGLLPALSVTLDLSFSDRPLPPRASLPPAPSPPQFFLSCFLGPPYSQGLALKALASEGRSFLATRFN